jgi:8-oxo-dGTP pyrophosphatase MutT (NUDIX family)
VTEEAEQVDSAALRQDPALLARISGVLDGSVPVAPARDAATVLLLRDRDGLQTYLLRRQRLMTFGGAHVFPGGAVDPTDETVDVAWAGPPPQWWGEQFDCGPEVARALVCAAVRETFEESGVLLAGPTADEVLADVGTDEWEAERRALEHREQSLSELLARRGLVLRADLLRPWTHWITPDAESRRFDTRFFLAALPGGQLGRLASGENDQGEWVAPSGWPQLQLLPPTRACLQDLAALPDVASALARGWQPHTVRVNWELTADGPVLTKRVSRR